MMSSPRGGTELSPVVMGLCVSVRGSDCDCVFGLLQTLAESWSSQTQWSGVENSSSPTMWTLTTLLLSGTNTAGFNSNAP